MCADGGQVSCTASLSPLSTICLKYTKCFKCCKHPHDHQVEPGLLLLFVPLLLTPCWLYHGYTMCVLWTPYGTSFYRCILHHADTFLARQQSSIPFTSVDHVQVLPHWFLRQFHIQSDVLRWCGARYSFKCRITMQL